ncbi:FctA domain-containing protein [Olsenella sp. An293]|uniref:Spy0128 family protein n=1 Tax=Olsenella sp. An293 TaxID=1965626 RepID=UPI000B3A83A4|nr:FctA domain-containing protein [Olsenella sp. An293]OUO33544.1 hypothetical protein B5F85_01375 [Olsenella sp. An293]
MDKSVSSEESVWFGENEVKNGSDFLVTYSALATSLVTMGQTPTDTVFILDLSASMTWGYDQSSASVSKEESRLTAMVNSVNSAIDTLVKANPDNRIAIVTFNGSCNDGQALMPNLMTGRVILEKVDNSIYLDVQNYNQNLEDGIDKATADVYCAINGNTASTGGGTNIQAGLFMGMSILANNTDTTYGLENGQEVTRIPNVILMSDGAPTTFSSANDAGYMSYDTTGSGEEHYFKRGDWQTGPITADSPVIRDTTNFSVESGSWWATNSGQQIGAGNNDDPDSADGFMALLTASYFKNAISDNYYGDSGEEANVYTIGFGTDVQDSDMVAMANLVLNPVENLGAITRHEQVDEVAGAWEAYQSGSDATVHAAIGDGSNTLHIPFKVAKCTTANNPTSLNYPTQYFAAADDEQLDQIFEEITNMITSSASAPTEVTGDPINDGYITYTDTTGQYMEIKKVKTLIFMNQMLNVTKNEDSSTPDRAVYVAADYEYDNPAYPGQSFNTNQIEIVVTDNNDNTQTITVKVPAALIPLRTNTVTLDGDGTPTNNEVSANLPLRLCYEVGLRADIDPTTLKGVEEDYIKNNTVDGSVNFYSNAYTENGETNNGVGATVEFEPAHTNPFYFVQEDTQLYVDANGTTPATGNLETTKSYYVPVTYYGGEGKDVKKETTYVERSGDTLSGYVSNDERNNLYLKAGSPRLGNLQDVTAKKKSNETSTYGNYREPTFVYDEGSTDPQKGHFVVLLGNNGKLSIPYMSKDVSLEDDSTHTSIDGQLVSVGEELRYTINWVNTAVDQNGNPDNAEIKIVDTIPGGTTYQESSATPEGAYDSDNRTLTWTIQATAGESGRVEFVVTVDESATDNTDNALKNAANIVVGENTYTTNQTINYVPEKSVSAPEAGGGTSDADGAVVTPGAELTYTIEYRNTEASPSTVVITDAVPDGTTFVSSNPKITPDQDGNLTWTMKNVAAGEKGSVSFTVKVDNSAVTTVNNKANVMIGNHDPAVTNEVTTKINRASLVIAKTVTATDGLTSPDADFDFDLTIDKMAGKIVTATVRTNGQPDSQTRELSFDVDGKASFSLKGGQSIEIPCEADATYSVTEEKTAGFSLTAIDGADTSDVGNATASGALRGDAKQVTFTNNYGVEPTTSTKLNIPLNGTKTIDRRSFQNGDAFTFTIAAAGATPDAPLPNKTEVTIRPTSGTEDEFAFGEITFTKPGEYRYIIQEVDYDTDNDDTTENPGGISYDSAIYRLNIVIVDNGDGTLRLARVDEIGSNSTQGNLVYTRNPMLQVYRGEGSSITEATEVSFTNTYNPDATSASIRGTKKLEVTNSDYALADGDFKFWIEPLGSTGESKPEYYASDFTTDPNQPKPLSNEAYNIANGNVTFAFATGAFTKDMVGKVYGYKITESAGHIMSDGVTYDDDTERIVWIAVTDDRAGNVVATVGPNDGGQPANNFTFTNSYTPQETTIGDGTTAGITVHKKFVGINWTNEYEFDFKISPVSVDGDTSVAGGMPMPDSDTISIGAPQSGAANTGSFGKMTFTKAGTYVYQIEELDDGDTHTACSDPQQTVTVKVEENEQTGALSATVTYEGDKSEAEFVNTYTPYISDDPTKESGGITVTKVLNGRDLVAGEFTFELLDANDKCVSSGTNDADGNVELSDVVFESDGTYEYTLVERPGTLDNVTYDTREYKVTATVTNNGDGTLSVVWTVVDAPNNTATFTNTYTNPGTPENPPVNPPEKPDDPTPSDPSKPDTPVTKTLTGRDMVAGEFSFVIEATGDNADKVTPDRLTGINDASGNVSFSGEGFTFSEAGDYTFTVSEVLPTDEDPDTPGVQHNGVTYDEATYTVTAHVAQEDGELVVTWDAKDGAKSFSFANTYEPSEKAEIVFGATKVLNGRDLVAGEFSFELRDADGNVIATAANAADGSVVFETPVVFTEAGTYTYTINEVTGSLVNVTYDTVVHTATVTVTDNGDGTLSAVVSYDGTGKLPVFTNTYTEPGEPDKPVTPGAPGEPSDPKIPDAGDATNFALPAVLGMGGAALVAGALVLRTRRSR